MFRKLATLLTFISLSLMAFAENYDFMIIATSNNLTKTYNVKIKGDLATVLTTTIYSGVVVENQEIIKARVANIDLMKDGYVFLFDANDNPICGLFSDGSNSGNHIVANWKNDGNFTIAKGPDKDFFNEFKRLKNRTFGSESSQSKKGSSTTPKAKQNPPAGGSINGHAYVDLGLPSGIKWATCNIGASSPEQYGSYYAWGETGPKSSYNQNNSITYGKSIEELKSAGITDSAGKLTPSYDAARANWGASWRMPTKAELDELLTRCKWTWTTQGGKKGYRITGPNGQSIFLPATGFREGTSLRFAGESGLYWSTKAYNNNDYAAALSIKKCVASYNRHGGFSIRPVSE